MCTIMYITGGFFMSIKKIIKYLSIGAIIFTSTYAFASEEYSLPLFNQLADKVTSLYLKEAIVGLDIIDDVYSDKRLLENIEVRLEKDLQTKKYLEERGFDLGKIRDMTVFINDIFPSAEEIVNPNKDAKNVIERLIVSALMEENNNLNYYKYEKGLEHLADELVEILPNEAIELFEVHFKTEQQKREAITKIIVEYIYSGHGHGIYVGENQEYIDLKLEIDDDFIKNVNNELGIAFLNKDVKRSINIILGGVEDTLKEKKLDKIYSDFLSVLNLIQTNCDNDLREENIENGLKVSDSKKDIIDVKEKKINRAEVLKLFCNLVQTEPKKYDFYADYIATAKNIGLISGYKDSTFRPNSKVTRSEMLSMISNTINFIDLKIEIDDSEIDDLLEHFKYKDDIEAWARRDIAKLVKLKILDKNYSKAFGAEELITRDEAMIIIDKMDIH